MSDMFVFPTSELVSVRPVEYCPRDKSGLEGLNCCCQHYFVEQFHGPFEIAVTSNVLGALQVASTMCSLMVLWFKSTVTCKLMVADGW